MQTTRGKDTANIRWNNIDLNSVDIKISEEQSKDTETRHTKEAVGYMLFSFQDKNPNDL
jgi:hypothetical protein